MTMRLIGVLRVVTTAGVFLLTGLLGLACEEPHQDIVYSNETLTSTSLFFNGTDPLVIPAGSSKISQKYRYRGEAEVRALDNTGKIICVWNVAWDDLKTMGWRVKISPDCKLGVE